MAERGVIFKDDFVTAPDKSWFDMSFDFLLSGNFGELIPTTCMECMPEDTIHAKSDSFVRLAPLVSPTFGKVNMFDYHFYVRNRSIWTQWESFISDKDQRKSWQQANPLWTPPEMPYIDVREVLFKSKLFIDELNNPFEFEVFMSGGHDGIERVTYYGLNALGNNYLVLLANDFSDSSDIESYITNRLQFIDFSQKKFAIVISYIENKSMDIPSHLRPLYYNPFSNGTLFDYLGVDLSGLYYNNYSLFRSSLDDLAVTISIPDATSEYQFSSDMTVNEKSTILPISVDLIQFLRTHAITSVGYGFVQGGSYFGAINDFKGTLRTVENDALNQHLVTDTPSNQYLYIDSETSKISALPLRAYHSIYIDYFRDQNYVSVNPCVDFSRDGNDVDWSQNSIDIFDYLTLNFKSYEHDPYTSALPQAQRGEPVHFLPNEALIRQSDKLYVPSGSSVNHGSVYYDGNSIAGTMSSTGTASSDIPYLVADLSAATIENLRFANALQKLKEREARSGGRYFELMEAIFGARIDDAKIDRPIFLGGDKTPIQVSEVLQTSATEVTTDQPLGQMAGRAVAIGNDDYIEYVTPDHGFFIEICAVLPRTNYQQGLLPMFTRKVRLDYPMPQFAQLGETQVPQSELWYTADESEDKKPFAFQSRYYDSKYQRDRTSGTFKDSLAHWTWSRIFDSAPVASKKFIEVHPDYRQFAVTDQSQEHVYIHMWHDIQVLRALPVFGTPKL